MLSNRGRLLNKKCENREWCLLYYLGAEVSSVEDILKQILSELKDIKTDIGELKTGQASLVVGQQKL